MKHRETVVALVLLLAAYAAIAHCTACASTKPIVAESTYLGQQLACVDKYSTREDIDQCRAAVHKRWATKPIAVTGTSTIITDGGAE